VALENVEVHAVREREFGDAFFEFLEVLRRHEKRRKQQEEGQLGGKSHFLIVMCYQGVAAVPSTRRQITAWRA